MKITGIIVGIIGAALIGLGGYLFFRESLFLQTAEQSTAVVTSNQRYTYTGQVNEYGVQHYYCSEFQFQTMDGRKISFKESSDSNVTCAELDSPPDYQAGQNVVVHYDPRDPVNTVQIPKSVKLYYDGAWITAIAGVLVLLFGIGLFLIGLLRRRKASAGGPAAF